MTHNIGRYVAVAVLVAAFVSVGTMARAQTYTGRIDITVEDSTGGRLPGVLVELSGGMIQTATSDARGEVHFLNLNVGTYQVKASLAGFNEWKSGNLPVAGGVSVPLGIRLTVAGAKEEVTVTGEAPVLDNKKQTTAVNVSLEELQNVPTARDPWVVMQSVPGIVMDRVNVGGSESGQQAGFMGKGASSGQTTWNVDGMPITDMSSLSSPFYYDFDMFQEMSVQTGGADAKAATGGIQMNMMLKSGTNVFHGSGRGFFENEGMQSKNIPDDLKFLAGKSGKGDRTQQFVDYGGELGGPVLKDRWWFWAAYGHQDIRILKLSDVRDRTILPNVSTKTQAQLTKSLRGSFTFFQANKQKFGRDASVQRPQETTYNQDGPNQMFKGELNAVLGNSFFLVGRWAHVKGGFTFDPQGGMDTLAYQDETDTWHGSYRNYVTDRPQDSFVADGNYFKGSHEIKFGFTWRKTQVHSTSQWPHDYYTRTYAGEYPNMIVNVAAIQPSDGESKYMNFYLGDTWTLKRATINFGVRYDHQVGSVLPSTSDTTQVPGAEGFLPKVTAPGVKNALTFNLLQPRVGLTYSLTESRKTQLRATYAMFTNQIGSGAASFLSVAQYRWFYVDAIDKNNDHTAQPGEIVWSTYAAHIANGDYGGYDPANPAASTATTFNKVGDYTVPKTHELIVGVDHELMPNFGVSASYTYRRNIDTNWQPYPGITAANYVQLSTLTGTLPTNVDGTKGGSYSVPIYGLANAALIPPGKGTIYEAHKGYWQTFKGFEVTATKRMSNRWMARVGFSTNSWREYWDGTPTGANGDPTPTLANPNINGGYVVSAASGSGKSGIYMVQPKYQFIANGAYQAPLGIDLGANYIIRQGYPMPWYRRQTGIKDPLVGSTKNVLLVPEFAQDRLPGVGTLDVRIGKTFRLSQMQLNFDFDIFNLLNSSTVLGREYNQAITSGTYPFTQVKEILQPRIARIGLRVGF